jgi:hypothetical protein
MSLGYENRNKANNSIIRNKFITLGTCVNNSDPKRAGRIRAIPPEGENLTIAKCDDPKQCIKVYDELAAKGELIVGGSKVQYIPWGINDPWTFSPFLPLPLHILPKVGEAVKLISWESEKNLNQEYIGPLISQPGAIELDGYQSGKENTAAGVNNKTLMPYAVPIGDSKINPISIPLPLSKGSFVNPDDIGLYGRNNTDIILGMSENSLVDETPDDVEASYPQILIRSGKLIKNTSISSRPTTNLKPTFIQISTFPQTLTRVEVEKEIVTEEDLPLSTLIEYKMDRASLCNTPMVFNGEVVVYKMPPKTSGGQTPMCAAYNNSTPSNTGGGVVAGPTTPQVGLTMTFTNAPTIKDIGRQINSLISNIDKEQWNKVLKQPNVSWATKTFSSSVDLNNQNNLGAFLGNTHPLYFRPEKSLLETIEEGEPALWPVFGTFDAVKAQVTILKNTIGLDGVKNKGGGLAFENAEGSRVVKKETKKVKEMVPGPPKSEQQGIITAAGEKIYLLSYNTNDLNGPITLNSNYGIPQAKFIDDIDSKTNSLVRGEKLLELLVKMAAFQANHTHSCPGVASCPTAHDGTTTSEIDKLIKEAGESILNKNIRIN